MNVIEGIIKSMMVIESLAKKWRTPIHIRQSVIPLEPQTWIEIILLVDDTEAARLSDWTVGYYHCSHCGTYQGFAHRLPSKDKYGNYPADPIMHNERNKFWREHAHGDGRVILFERDMEVPQP